MAALSNLWQLDLLSILDLEGNGGGGGGRKDGYMLRLFAFEFDSAFT